MWVDWGHRRIDCLLLLSQNVISQMLPLQSKIALGAITVLIQLASELMLSILVYNRARDSKSVSTKVFLSMRRKESLSRCTFETASIALAWKLSLLHICRVSIRVSVCVCRAAISLILRGHIEVFCVVEPIVIVASIRRRDYLLSAQSRSVSLLFLSARKLFLVQDLIKEARRVWLATQSSIAGLRLCNIFCAHFILQSQVCFLSKLEC